MLREVLCPYCHGKGTIYGTYKDACPICEGVGHAMVFTEEHLVKLKCRRCSGKGETTISSGNFSYAHLLRPSITNLSKCPECHGRGYVETLKCWVSKMDPTSPDPTSPLYELYEE